MYVYVKIHRNDDGTFSVFNIDTGGTVKDCERLDRDDAEFACECWNEKIRDIQRRNNVRLRRAGIIGDVRNAYGFAMLGEAPVFTEYA